MDNPAEDTELPQIEKTDEDNLPVFSVNDQVILVEYAQQSYMSELWLFNLVTGMRIRELMALKCKNINFDEKTMKVEENLKITKICKKINIKPVIKAKDLFLHTKRQIS